MPVLYHHIEVANTEEDYHVTQEPELPEDVELVFGVKLEEKLVAKLPKPLVFEVNFPSKEELPHFVGETIPVFSDALVKTFRSAGVENFQVFPAVLRNPEINAEWDGFWVFHEIGLIAAANLDKSESDSIMEGDSDGGVDVPLIGFQVLVLDKKKTRNVALFRLAESPDILLIHDRVLSHLKKKRPPGGWGFDVTEIETV